MANEGVTIEMVRAGTAVLKRDTTNTYNAAVYYVQGLLNAAGYNCGTPDGKFGSGTRTQVKAFQTARGLTSDGIVGRTTLAALEGIPVIGPNYGVTLNDVRNGIKTLSYDTTNTPSDAVEYVQGKLNDSGFNNGTPDGKFGTGTKNAVIAFQTKNNITADGVVNNTTLSLLEGTSGVGYNGGITLEQVRNGSAYLKYDIKTVSDAVSGIQLMLNEQGYSCGRPDGKFGSGTVTAVRAFQTASNLTSDGIIGSGTLAKIEQNVENPVGPNNGVTIEQVRSGNAILKYDLITRSEAVAYIQELLNKGFFSCGKADGIYGGGTRDSVKAFQSACQIKEDGIVGKNTLALLEDESAELSGPNDGVTLDQVRSGIKYLKYDPITQSDAVTYVQEALANRGYDVGNIDGIYGSATRYAVKTLQRDFALQDDGIVGVQVMAVLDNPSYGVGTNATTYVRNDNAPPSEPVKQIQRRLWAYDNALEVSGVFNLATENAVKAFQNRNNLTATGAVDPTTWRKMFPLLRSGSSLEEAVRALQTLLTYQNFVVGVDGNFGSATKNAVRSYQTMRGLDADGIAGPKTWLSLTLDTPIEGSGGIGTGETAPLTGFPKYRASDFIEFLKSRVGCGYTLGTYGQKCTQELLERRARRDADNSTDYYLVDCARWLGYYVTDCSGLVEWFLLKNGIQKNCDTNASGMYNRWSIEKSNNMDDMPLVPGVAVYKRGASGIHHIGIYVGNDRVIEAKGAAYGVLVTQFSADPKWNCWGIFDWLVLDVEENPTATPLPVMTIATQLSGYPSLNNSTTEGVTHNRPSSGSIYKEGSKGDEVIQIQRRLWAYDNAITVNGNFGPATKAAVQAFQTRHSLTVDGIVGKNTWGKLFPLTTTATSNHPETINAIKALLVFRGYEVNNSVSTYNTELSNIVKSFQTAKGITSDGKVGEMTWAALTSNNSVMRKNNGTVEFSDVLDGRRYLEYDPDTISEGVKEVQLILRRLGYSCGVTKKFDNATLSAYTEFNNSIHPTRDAIMNPRSNSTLKIQQSEAIKLASKGGHPTAEAGCPYPTVENMRTQYVSISKGKQVVGCEGLICTQLLTAIVLAKQGINKYNTISTEYTNDAANNIMDLLGKLYALGNPIHDIYNNVYPKEEIGNVLNSYTQNKLITMEVFSIIEAAMRNALQNSDINYDGRIGILYSSLYKLGYCHWENFMEVKYMGRTALTVYAFQRQFGLTSNDGCAGDGTVIALNNCVNSNIVSADTRDGSACYAHILKNADTYGVTTRSLLARTIYSEGNKGSLVELRKAIAKLIFNRYRRRYNGKTTMRDIVMDPHQFGGMEKCDINVSLPVMLSEDMSISPVWRNCLDLADALIAAERNNSNSFNIDSANPPIESRIFVSTKQRAISEYNYNPTEGTILVHGTRYNDTIELNDTVFWGNDSTAN